MLTKLDVTEIVDAMLKTLTFRERGIVEARYGMRKGYEGCNMTLEEMGRLFKVTRERVRQLLDKAEQKLRNRFKKEAVND